MFRPSRDSSRAGLAIVLVLALAAPLAPGHAGEPSDDPVDGVVVQQEVAKPAGQAPQGTRWHFEPAGDHWIARSTGAVATFDPQGAWLGGARLDFIGASGDAKLVGGATVAGISNYFIGEDPSGWRTAVPRHASVQYQDLYDGVDAVFYEAADGSLEYDFLIAPRADPTQIVMRFDGHEGLQVTPTGGLALAGTGTTIQPPFAYQDTKTGRQEVPSAYVVDEDVVRFELGAYDPRRPLVIDPKVGFSTHFGGTDFETSTAIKADPATGAIYVGGRTQSNQGSEKFPLKSAYDGSQSGSIDAWLAKFDAAGQLVWSTYLGGSASEEVRDIDIFRVDANTVRVAAVGWTGSSNFPRANVVTDSETGYSGNAFHGGTEGFLTVFTDAGATPTLYTSSYLGGGYMDEVQGVAFDSAGEIALGGATRQYVGGPNFPATTGAFQTEHNGPPPVPPTGSCCSWWTNPENPKRGGWDAFAAKLTADGTNFRFSSLLGGSGHEQGRAVAVDGAGNVLVAGYSAIGTNAEGEPPTPFPTTPGAYRTSPYSSASDYDGFVTRFSPTGDALSFSTFLGGTSHDYVEAIDLDAAGNVYVAGNTFSSNLPKFTGSFQTNLAGTDDGFAFKLNPTGSAALGATYVGGSGSERAFSIDESDGKVYIAGWKGGSSASPAFPAKGQERIQCQLPSNDGKDDALWVMQTSTDFTDTLYNVKLSGGRAFDARVSAIEDGVAFTGMTYNLAFPTTEGVAFPDFAGFYDAVIGTLHEAGPCAKLAITSATPVAASTPVGFDASASVAGDHPLGATPYSWDWEADGTIDYGPTADANPTYAGYDSAGPKTVRVTVTDEKGYFDTAEVTLDVTNGAPTAAIDTDPSGLSNVLEGEIVTFTGTGSTDPEGAALTYSWDFDGDGEEDATGETASHAFAVAGTYTVTLTVTDSASSTDAASLDLTVTVATEPTPPTASFSANPLVVTLGDAVTFTDASVLADSIAWDFDGDGKVDSTQKTPSWTFTTSGTKTVRLAATNEYGSDMATATIQVQTPMELLVTMPEEGLVGKPVGATATATGDDVTLDWSFGDGGHGAGGSVEHVYDEANTYLVTIVASDAWGNSLEVERSIFIAAPPPIASDGERPFRSGGGQAPLTPVAPPPPLTLTAGSDVHVAEGQAVRLQATGTGAEPLVWAWHQVDGPAVTWLEQNDAKTAVLMPSLAGHGDAQVMLEVTVTDALGRQETDLVVLHVSNLNRAPTVDAWSSLLAQSGERVDLEARATDPDGDPLTVQWVQRDGVPVAWFADEGPQASFAAPEVEEGQRMLLHFQASANDGAVEVLGPLVQVEVAGPASVMRTLDVGREATTTGSIRFLITPAGLQEPLSYTWSFGDGHVSTEAAPVHDYAGPGSYEATVTVQDATGARATGSTVLLVAPPAAPDGEALRPPAAPRLPWIIAGVALAVASLSLWRRSR